MTVRYHIKLTADGRKATSNFVNERAQISRRRSEALENVVKRIGKMIEEHPKRKEMAGPASRASRPMVGSARNMAKRYERLKATRRSIGHRREARHRRRPSSACRTSARPAHRPEAGPGELGRRVRRQAAQGIREAAREAGSGGPFIWASGFRVGGRGAEQMVPWSGVHEGGGWSAVTNVRRWSAGFSLLDVVR